MNERIGNKISPLVTDAFCIALLTFITYAGSYLYKFSYLSYFGIPSYLVQVELSDVLAIACFTLVYLLSSVLIIDSLSNFLKPETARLKRNLILFLTLIFIIFAPLVFSLFDPLHPYWSIFFLSLIIALFVASIYAIASSKDDSKNESIKPRPEGLLSIVEKELGAYPIITSVLLIMFIMDCFLLGNTIARDNQYFLTPNLSSNVVIITEVDNKFLGVTYNPATHIFEREIIFINYNELNSVQTLFTLKKIGHLYNPEKIFAL